jgi:hypothetical protein
MFFLSTFILNFAKVFHVNLPDLIIFYLFFACFIDSEHIIIVIEMKLYIYEVDAFINHIFLIELRRV